MKRFKFQLQKVLDIRERREDALKDERTKLNYILQIEKQKLSAINQEIDSAQEKKKALQNTPHANPNEIEDYYIYIQSQLTRRGNQILHIKIAQEHVDKKRDELIEAAKQKKILEKLKEKQEFNHLWELDRAEQKTIDELAGYMDGRKSSTKIKLSDLIQPESKT